MIAIGRQEIPEDLASSHGKRVGILVVAYNAVTTLSGVLERIPAAVWRNVEQWRCSTTPARIPPMPWRWG